MNFIIRKKVVGGIQYDIMEFQTKQPRAIKIENLYTQRTLPSYYQLHASISNAFQNFLFNKLVRYVQNDQTIYVKMCKMFGYLSLSSSKENFTMIQNLFNFQISGPDKRLQSYLIKIQQIWPVHNYKLASNLSPKLPQVKNIVLQ